MKQIDERTMIPMTWAIAALTTLLGPAVVGAMWVKGVNDRLARIETKLHIQVEAKAFGINDAQAEEKR